jgi:hypothetical protein
VDAAVPLFAKLADPQVFLAPATDQLVGLEVAQVVEVA